MSHYIAIRDARLSGNFPQIFNQSAFSRTDGDRTCITTGQSTPLNNVFQAVNQVNADGYIDTIFILCHGFAGSSALGGYSGDVGGEGLQLGHENLLHSNVSMWNRIGGKARNIVVYSCAAANTEVENIGTPADGRYLMGALAIHTSANVYAADRIQWYNPTTFSFSSWEGQLLHFTPSGTAPREVSHPPKEFLSVFR